MKVLFCILLLTISCQVILCEDVNLAPMVNTAIPQILEGGVYEGKLPGGPYYLHHIIKSSIGAQNTYLTLDVRRLDNQTNVTVKATIDNSDFSVKSSCFTSEIGENIIALSQGWRFEWIYYSSIGWGDDYCNFPLDWDFIMDWHEYELTAENLALDSAIKSTYEYLWDSLKGDYKYIAEQLNPDIPPGPIKFASNYEYFFILQSVGETKSGEYRYYLFSIYRPCTGEHFIRVHQKELLW